MWYNCCWNIGLKASGPREKDLRRTTALNWAAKAGKIDVLKLLLELWPEATREKDRDGNTPLPLAADWRRIAVVRLLVENWPEGKKELNERGQTPLSVFGRQMLNRQTLKRRPQAKHELEEEGRLLLR
jgi:hypothetical protein